MKIDLYTRAIFERAVILNRCHRSCRINFCLAILVFTFCGPTSKAIASDSDLLERFLAEYRSSAQALEKASARIRMLAVETYHGDENGFLWEQQTEYLRDGNLVRKYTTVTRSDHPATPIGMNRVWAGNAFKWFQAHRQRAGDRFTLDDFGTKSTSEHENELGNAFKPLFASTRVDTIRVADWLATPGTQIAGARERRIDGVPIVEITLEELSDGKVQSRNLLFFHPRTWALAGATLPIAAGPDAVEIRVSYMDDSHRTIRSLRRWVATAENTKSDEISTDVKTIDHPVIAPPEFRLASIGLPEPESGSVDPIIVDQTRHVFKQTASMFVMLASGVAALLVAVHFARRKNRPQSVSAAPKPDQP